MNHHDSETPPSGWSLGRAFPAQTHCGDADPDRYCHESHRSGNRTGRGCRRSDPVRLTGRSRRRGCCCCQATPLAWKAVRFLRNSGLNSLKDACVGPAPSRLNRLLSASCGWTGVTLRGCISWDCSSSLTWAISWRGRVL